MRPLRLSMTAFGPYAGTETVDFDALTGLGLFVVAGNNGSGKTTIFDALHYSLFGTLPGRRASYIRLKSDHADDKVECKVVLDFVAHGRQWRVERSPKQKRPKRRGNGVTQVERKATLYRLDHGADGPTTAVANKIGEVDQRCRELVGLSGKQFERVALLPQGEFSRVLRESSTDRRELLRTLFSSEIFEAATADLTARASAASAQDRTVLERIDHQQSALTAELSALVGHDIDDTVPALQRAIADYRTGSLAAYAAQADSLEVAAQQAGQAHRDAITVGERIKRRAQVRQAQLDHDAARAQFDGDTERLDQARAAVPVTSQSRAVQHQQGHLDAAQARVVDLHQRLSRALTSAGLAPVAIDSFDHNAISTTQATVGELLRLLGLRHDATGRLRDIDAATKRAQGELRLVGNEIASLAEQMNVAQSLLRQTTAENERLDTIADVDACEHALRAATAQLDQITELRDIETEHQLIVRRSTDLDVALEHTETALASAQLAQASHAKLQLKANAAYDTLQNCTRRREAVQQYQSAMTQLTQVRADHERARSQVALIWDAFIGGTAARVAEALVDDQACPVCGSEEHPAPAVADSGANVATEADLLAARAHADTLDAQVRRLELGIENLHTNDADIATLSLIELDAEISTAKAMALGARAVADDAHQAAAHAEQLQQNLAQARVERNDLVVELRALDERRNHLRGALGDVATDQVAAVRARVGAALAASTEANELVERRAEVETAMAGATQDIENIGLGQLAAESRRASSEDQLSDRQAERDHAADELATIDHDLAALHTASASETHVEKRAQAARHAHEILPEIATALALRDDAADGVRRAQSILVERLAQSPFASVDTAVTAFVDPAVIEQLEAQTTSYVATGDRLRGQLHELADLPDAAPDSAELETQAGSARAALNNANRVLITATSDLSRLEADLNDLVAEREQRQTQDLDTRRLERVAALAKGDNDRNTSFENWVLAAHLRDVVELANIRLARSTHQRFQLCVLDDGENKRGTWGLDLGVEDTVTGTRRPTAGLSGGELFQASLALALGLADAVMNQSAGVRIDALFIDEGFGSLDETSVERAIDLLDELRDRGAMVGVITHVPALLDALPLGVRVIDAPDGEGSTIRQQRLAA